MAMIDVPLNVETQKELDELRESTRAALMKSWAEVEALQGEKDVLEERLFEMEVELTQSLEREAEWKRLYEELKKLPEIVTAGESSGRNGRHSPVSNQGGLGAFLNKGRKDNSADPPPLSSSVSDSGDRGLGNFLNKGRNIMIRGVKDMNSDRAEWTSDDDMDDPTIYSEFSPNRQRWGWRGKRQREAQEKLRKQINDYEKEKQELMAEWQVKLECRETAIQSMEETTQLQGQTLEELRAELHQVRREMQELDEEAGNEIERLQKKLDEKRKHILKQQDKLGDYKEHIRDLTDQLEKLTGSRGASRVDIDTRSKSPAKERSRHGRTTQSEASHRTRARSSESSHKRMTSNRDGRSSRTRTLRDADRSEGRRNATDGYDRDKTEGRREPSRRMRRSGSRKLVTDGDEPESGRRNGDKSHRSKRSDSRRKATEGYNLDRPEATEHDSDAPHLMERSDSRAKVTNGDKAESRRRESEKSLRTERSGSQRKMTDGYERGHRRKEGERLRRKGERIGSARSLTDDYEHDRRESKRRDGEKSYRADRRAVHSTRAGRTSGGGRDRVPEDDPAV